MSFDINESFERAAAQVLAGLDGPSTRQAAINALAGSAEDVRAFVNGGWKTATCCWSMPRRNARTGPMTTRERIPWKAVSPRSSARCTPAS